MFWTLVLGLASALNLVFLAQDLFNLFVALELLTFAAVPLVSLDGRAKTVSAALRYLLTWGWVLRISTALTHLSSGRPVATTTS